MKFLHPSIKGRKILFSSLAVEYLFGYTGVINAAILAQAISMLVMNAKWGHYLMDVDEMRE